MQRTVKGLMIMLLAGLSACSTTPPAPSLTPEQQRLRLQTQPLKTPLYLPVEHVRTQQLKDTWGAARSQGRRHEGIDIMAAKGTKVFSATDGIIADLKDNRLGGKVVWIRGPQNSWHYYAHLDGHKRGLNVGQWVNRGDLIGYVGHTGNAQASAPHLHYGIYLQGKGRGAVNPYPYLR